MAKKQLKKKSLENSSTETEKENRGTYIHFPLNSQDSNFSFINALDIKVGDLFSDPEYPGKAFKAKKVVHVKCGKHGAAKCVITAEDVLTTKRKDLSIPGSKRMTSIYPKKEEYFVVNFEKKKRVALENENDEDEEIYSFDLCNSQTNESCPQPLELPLSHFFAEKIAAIFQEFQTVTILTRRFNDWINIEKVHK